MSERLTQSLQESIITLICTNDEQGKIAAGLVDLTLLEPPFDDIAVRAINYRKQYKKAPGIAHLDDLFDHVLSDPKNKRQRVYQQILAGIIEQAKGLNAPYILNQLNGFMRSQRLKAAVIDAGTRYQRGGDDLVPDVEAILHKALRLRSDAMDSGTWLSDKKRILGFLNNTRRSFGLGIPELDRRDIGPTRGEAMAFMAPQKRGKTWWCIHCGVTAILQGLKVAHISLEMSDERIMPRYLQRLFAVAKRPDEFDVTRFEQDKHGKVLGFARETQKPELYFSDPRIDRKLGRKFDEWGDRFDRLVVKAFPTKSLTMGQLEAYLDGLEATHKFIPDLLIVDYPKLMALPGNQDFRIAFGVLTEELRGLCVRRNVAGVFPVQSNREGEGAPLLGGKHIGEDYSQGATVDLMLTYNQTKMEKELGLARLHVSLARNEESEFTVLISQNYRTGQFVLQSASMMGNDYWGKVKKAAGVDDGDSS